MGRVWLISALGVAAVVGAVLWFTRPAASGATTGSQAPAVQTLSERDVRRYIEYMPVFLRIVGQAAQRYAANPLEQKSVQGEIEASCVAHHLTLQDWEALRRRVEFVVDVIRFEENKPERDLRYEEELARKLELLERSEGQQREIVQRDIDQLKADYAAGAPALHAADRELVRTFRRDLDALVPKTSSKGR